MNAPTTATVAKDSAPSVFFMPATPQAAGTTPPQTTTPTQNKIAESPPTMPARRP